MSFSDPKIPVPARLETDEFVLRPIRAADAACDHAAVMETLHDLRVWEQSGWPEESFSVEANRKDLVDLEQRHAERRAFTYTVMDAVAASITARGRYLSVQGDLRDLAVTSLARSARPIGSLADRIIQRAGRRRKRVQRQRAGVPG